MKLERCFLDEFQPALPMRGVTTTAADSCRSAPLISTRTPHAGSDIMRAWNSRYSKLFQPALPMRGVTPRLPSPDGTKSFQPALPMRGVTLACSFRSSLDRFQPALPMRGVTAKAPAMRGSTR